MRFPNSISACKVLPPIVLHKHIMTSQYDVIVVGKGNAALSAALSATDNGAKVLVLEAASEEESGGNSRFAGGVMRFAYESVDDLKRVTDLTDEEVDALTRLLTLPDNDLMNLLLGQNSPETELDLPHVHALLTRLRQA